jgi:N-acyl-D-amino-acid deacylase
LGNEFDIIIKNAKIVDGINKTFEGSIGIKNDRILELGRIDSESKITIDADGIYAMPGFVDPHNHGDWGLPYYPECQSAVMQGCTTIVGGQCGGSPAPLEEYMRPPGVLYDEVYQRNPYLYHSPTLMSIDEINEIHHEKFGWNIEYRNMAEYFAFIIEKGISINYVPLLGHGTVRFAVMGKDYKREAEINEIDSMKELIHQGIREGCRGLSAGLDYDPDVFASRMEMEQCVQVLKEYDAVYSPHWRRTGRRRNIKMGSYSAEPIEGIREVIDTARSTGVKTNIAHLAPGWSTNAPMTQEIGTSIGKSTLDPIDEAISNGDIIGFDVIPWQCWEPLPYLCSLHFTQWLRLLGSRDKLAEWLKSEEFRKKAWKEIESGELFQRLVINPCINPHWSENLIIVQHSEKEYFGISLKEASEKMRKSPWDTLCELIILDPNSKGSHTDYRGIEAQMKEFFKHPLGAVGLDVGISDNNDIEKKFPPYAIPLPDQFSGYPKFFMRYVRDSDFLSIEEAVQKCATVPAKTFKIKDRGLLIPGAFADIVLMDLKKLGIPGDPEISNEYPTGIKHVLVNGIIVVENGKHTGNRPGSVLTLQDTI